MTSSKFSIGRIIADIISFLIVAIGALVVLLAPFHPVQRGFFCDDQTIQYPYREDTVSTALAGVLGIIVPCIPIIFLEALRLWFAQKDECSTKFNCSAFIKNYCKKLWIHVGVFVFGAAICLLITEFLKLTVGRLRPHFIDLCRPDPTSYNCSDGYIINFRCSSGAAEATLEDARKSFPSGHSSFTVFSVTYLVMYLQIRLPHRETRLLRPMLQTVFIVGSFYVLVSRISDHKHHWSDVLAGSILGLVCAVFTILFISDLWTPANKELAAESNILPMTMMPPSSPTAGQYNVSRVHSDQGGSSKGD